MSHSAHDLCIEIFFPHFFPRSVPNQDHPSVVLTNILSGEQCNKALQSPSHNAGSYIHASTSVQDSGMSSANSSIQEMSVSSNSTATSDNQEKATSGQVSRRHELLVEVLSQFEKRLTAQQDKNIEVSKRKLDSNNGIAFDWGKLPRIGTVHSVKGIAGLETVNTSTDGGSKESSSEAPSSRMGNIKMAELARLILNGTFDNFLSANSTDNQSDGNRKTTASSLNIPSQDSTQVPRVEKQVLDSRVGSSSQDMAVNSVPANDSYPYHENRQQEITNQRVASFSQSSANLNTSTTTFNTMPPYHTTSGRYDLQSNQRTSYNTNDGNVAATGTYDTQPRTNNNVYAGNQTTSPSFAQTASYNSVISPNRTANGRPHDLQSNQTTSYGTSLNSRNVSHMTHGQTPGVYGRTPVQTSYPRPLNSSALSTPRVTRTINAPLSNHHLRIGGSRDYRYLYPHNQDFRFSNRAVRTARVEPLSNQTNIVHPSPRATRVTTSNTLTSPTAMAPSPGSDLAKNAEHDSKSCLDCLLLGTCPIKKAIDAEKEKERARKDSSDEEPELLITKVTTKDAERGPIERIDVDEWVASSESHSDPVKVKQEPRDKEEVTPTREERNSEINNVVNQMRLMAQRMLTDDGVLDLGTATADRNEQNSVDKDSTSDPVSVQDSVGGSNVVDREQIAVSEVVSTQPSSDTTERCGQDSIMENSATVSQEAACEISEESNAVRDLTSETTSDQLTTSKVTGKGIAEDGASMNTQLASEVTEESIIPDHVTEVDINMATDNARDPVTSIAMGTATQTAPKVIGNSFFQEHVTKDITLKAQLSSEVNEESISQGRVTNGVAMDTQPVSESMDDVTNVDKQTTCRVVVVDVTNRNGANESSTATVRHNYRPLACLKKNIKSLESCISFLKERANTNSNPVESEYDKGDRNYQKYVSMEGGQLVDDQAKDLSVNTESIDNSDASQTVNQKPRKIIEMSSQDKELVAHLERKLQENEENLKIQNDIGIRIRCLKERLFMLKKIERINQKYELMSLQDREAVNKLERALERNREKLKNQNVDWIRKHCLKARFAIFKRIERIRKNYGLPPEKPSFINEDLEFEVLCEVNTVRPAAVEKDVPHTGVPDQENVFELTNKSDSIQVTTAENQENQPLSSKSPNQEAEEVTTEEESALETPGTGLDDKEEIEERDPASSEKPPSTAEPSVVIKNEGIQHSDVVDAFTLEDAIQAFVEKPQDGQEETSSGIPSSSSSPKNQEDISPLQNKNQENRTGFSGPSSRNQDSSDKPVLEKTAANSSTESLPVMNCNGVNERTHRTDREAQPNQLPGIQDISMNENEVTVIVTDRAVQTERNRGHLKPCSSSSRTEHLRESANIANNTTEPPASENIVRMGKRKLEASDEHVPIKKEKIDADQENTPQKESNNNIWDFIKKYSH